MGNRYHNKAWIITEAWRREFGSEPDKRTIAMVFGPAEAETGAGDAVKSRSAAERSWAGEVNWGAVQKTVAEGGKLTPQEAELLVKNGVKIGPEPLTEDDVMRARDTLRLHGQRYLGLHRDSTPLKEGGSRWYLVFFWAFDNHIDAAQRYLKALSMFIGRGRVLTIGNMTPEQLAAAMYDGGYYQGFTTNREAAIADYAKKIASATAAMSANLVDWHGQHDEGAEYEGVTRQSPPEPSGGGSNSSGFLAFGIGATLAIGLLALARKG